MLLIYEIPLNVLEGFAPEYQSLSARLGESQLLPAQYYGHAI